MREKFIFTLITTAMAVGSVLAQSNFSPLDSSTQIVLVTTKNWDALQGELKRFARADAQAPWKQVGATIPIVVGRSGLGWGRGIHPSPNPPGPVKHEGDGKSPAGIFRLSSAFGQADADKMKSVKLPYRQLTNGVECVDDTNSTRYNSITTAAQSPKPDWNSSEKMWKATNSYRLGVVVDHNDDPAESGGGSCVFIHIWDDAQTGTSGCTAMAPANMETLLYWLNPAAKPVLVQLPEADHQQLQTIWQLP